MYTKTTIIHSQSILSHLGKTPQHSIVCKVLTISKTNNDTLTKLSWHITWWEILQLEAEKSKDTWRWREQRCSKKTLQTKKGAVFGVWMLFGFTKWDDSCLISLHTPLSQGGHLILRVPSSYYCKHHYLTIVFPNPLAMDQYRSMSC